MENHRKCPFCEALHSRYPIADLKCQCGAKYHREADVWVFYDKAKKERKEVKGDLWNEMKL
jgi:hypothetical protein